MACRILLILQQEKIKESGKQFRNQRCKEKWQALTQFWLSSQEARLRKRNWCYSITWLHFIWTMFILVNKYVKDHTWALKPNDTEEPQCTLLTVLLPKTQWLHSNRPSGMVAWPHCDLSCAQEFGSDCQYNSCSRAWQCFLAPFKLII